MGQQANAGRAEEARDQGEDDGERQGSAGERDAGRDGRGDGRARRHVGDALEQDLAQPDRVAPEAWWCACGRCLCRHGRLRYLVLPPAGMVSRPALAVADPNFANAREMGRQRDTIGGCVTGRRFQAAAGIRLLTSGSGSRGCPPAIHRRRTTARPRTARGRPRGTGPQPVTTRRWGTPTRRVRLTRRVTLTRRVRLTWPGRLGLTGITSRTARTDAARSGQRMRAGTGPGRPPGVRVPACRGGASRTGPGFLPAPGRGRGSARSPVTVLPELLGVTPLAG